MSKVQPIFLDDFDQFAENQGEYDIGSGRTEYHRTKHIRVPETNNEISLPAQPQVNQPDVDDVSRRHGKMAFVSVFQVEEPAQELRRDEKSHYPIWEHFSLFLAFNTASLFMLYLIYSVPLKTTEYIELFNHEFWLFALSIGFIIPFSIMYIVWSLVLFCQVFRKLDSALFDLKKRIVLLTISVCTIIWSTIICLLIFMILLEIYPLPFYGTVFGSLILATTAPFVVGVHIYFVIPGLDKKDIFQQCIKLSKMLIIMFFVCLMEVPFMISIYKLSSDAQLFIVISFQVCIILTKLFTRIYIRKCIDLSGHVEDCNAYILVMNYLFEYLLQFYVSIVSPRIVDSSALVVFLSLESLSLALSPAIDSVPGRAIIKSLFKCVLPSKSDSIERALTVSSENDRILSLTNCAMNFFVRINACICSTFLGLYVYYGYNRDAFAISEDLTARQVAGSMYFFVGSFVVVTVQYFITRRILLRVYGLDMHLLWMKELSENFVGFLCVLVNVLVHAATTILHVYYSLSYVMGSHHE